MVQRSHPSALRWLVGVELARYRNRVGLTLAELAEHTKISRPKLGHLETAERRQAPEDIVTILEACGAAADDIDRLTKLALLPDITTWWNPWSDVVPDWLGTIIGLERMATSEFVFEPMQLPGLMQTPDYAQAMTEDATRVRRDHVARVVEVRMQRIRRLTDTAKPLNLHAVVTDFGLRLRVGSPEVRRAQYEHLIELANRPNVTLQVLTPECGPHGACTGQFIVLDFELAESIGYVELQDQAIYVHHLGEVNTHKETARSLKTVALSPEDSLSLVTELSEGR